ncbi:MAG: transposase [Anaerolineae bacterium]|nr:transposase [Anaerolineae bacterium]
MSLKTTFPAEIPEDTRRLAEPLMAADSVYRLVGQTADEFIDEAQLAKLYAVEGRGAVNPVVLALVVVFQFVEKLPDRQAALMAVMRLDWKYALRQRLEWAGFHYADLSNFRKRLLTHGQERAVFEGVVSDLRDQGHIRRGGKQRTDSTHILGVVEQLSRLELVWEMLRMALGALLSSDAVWVLRWLPASFVQQYSTRREDYRLSEEEVAQEMQAAGQDGCWLLAQLDRHGTEQLRHLPEVAQLKRVLDEQFEQGEGPPTPRPPQDCTGDVLGTPHDPDVRYRQQGSTGWQGYQLQVTETADEDQPVQFITAVEVNSALAADQLRLAPIQRRLARLDLLPARHYVDQNYMSGHNLTASQRQGIALRGLIGPDTSHKPQGFRLADFTIDLERQQATCPAGRQAIVWSTTRPDRRNDVAYQVRFGRQCLACAHFGSGGCTASSQGRHLRITPYHDLSQARRHEALQPSFQREMRTRAAIEGTVSELVRAHGARQARYCGLTNNQLQAAFIAAAANLKRLARCLILVCAHHRLLFSGSRPCSYFYP